MRRLKRTGRTRPKPLLKTNLRQQLAALTAYFEWDDDERAQRRPPIDHSVYRHPEVSEQILHNQQSKCAYCELMLDEFSINVTHYRPLSNARHSEQDHAFIDYYAWFAYEWQNLLVVCSECHHAMSEMFPLVDGKPAPRRASWQVAERVEKPLLLNPYTANPSKHLMFTHHGEAIARSNEGKVTIEVLQLNRPKLVAERAQCFEEMVQIFECNTGSGLFFALDAFIKDRAEFPGASIIFLQDLCRVAHDNPPLPEPLVGNALIKQVVKVLTGLSSDQIISLVGMLNDRNIRFLIFNTELGGFVSPNPHPSGPIVEISIKRFKALTNISLRLSHHDDATPCMMLLGENATGKSSVLQAIQLALCSAQDRARLRRACANLVSKLHPMEIEITFESGNSCKLTSNRNGKFEVNHTAPSIVLGYGARRYFSPSPRTARAKYLNQTLFNPLATLRDPSDWLAEQTTHRFHAIARALRSILSLREDESIIQTNDRTLLIKTHDKLTPIDQLSDGYKSLFIMSIDIMRELLEHWHNLEVAEGIVLIDEVETHLHPRWKMRVMTALREAMPRVQFICSTHDPLCLRGMKNGEVRLLQRDSQHVIQAHAELPDITTLRIEQILSSDYFGLGSTDDPQQDFIIRRLAELAGVGERRLSKDQRLERDRLLARYEGIPFIGSSLDRQILAEALTRHLHLHPETSIEDRGRARVTSIDAILGVLKRAMKQ